MIKIYGSTHSAAFRCYWLLEELGIPYEMFPLDFAKREHKTPEYLKLNPNGKVPTMVDDDFVLWESMAINYYLAEKQQAMEFMGNSLREHAEINKWNMWAITGLTETVLPLVMQKFQNLPADQTTKASREEWMPRYLAVLEAHLAGKEYMAFGKFTLADITVMSVVRLAGFVDFDLSSYPNIISWMSRLSERPAYKKAAV